MCITTCNTLQHTATHYNTLQHTATHYNVPQYALLQRYVTYLIPVRDMAHSCVYHNLQHIATRCNALQHTATHCNTLQHTATHHNVLQHTLTTCRSAPSTHVCMHSQERGVKVCLLCVSVTHVIGHITNSDSTATQQLGCSSIRVMGISETLYLWTDQDPGESLIYIEIYRYIYIICLSACLM